MPGKERFIFGIPLIARAVAEDWDRVGDLLELTLRSVCAQTDGEFEVIVAGHDRPVCLGRRLADDPRFSFLPSEWAPEPPTPRNDDAGMKKWRIKERVQTTGGGLLMYLDADDLIDRRTVETARARLEPEHVGGIVGDGVLLDYRSWRALPVPDPQAFDGRFHELCGSSTVARIEPGSTDPVRRDPHEALGSHHRWPENAADLGVLIAELPLCGAYLVNTSLNHSERHGPYSDWRTRLNHAVATRGRPLDRTLSVRLGLEEGRARAVGS